MDVEACEDFLPGDGCCAVLRQFLGGGGAGEVVLLWSARDYKSRICRGWRSEDDSLGDVVGGF